MKIALSFCLLLLFIFFPCKAQFNCLGGDIDLTVSHELSLQNGRFVSDNPTAKELGIGFALHLNSEINFSSHFSINPYLGLESWRIGNAPLTGGEFLLVTSALVRFYPAHTDFDNPKIRWYCQAGPYYGLGTGAKSYYLIEGESWPDSRSIYGLKLGTGVNFPLWNGFVIAGVDMQSNILFTPSFDLHYSTGTTIKTKTPVYNILFSVGYSYPFSFRYFKFVSYTFNQGTK